MTLADRLIEAAEDADAKLAGELLAEGAEPDGADSEGITPLYAAVGVEAREVVERLLAAGADVNRASRAGPPLSLVAHISDDLVQRLLAAGADPEAADAYGSTPLYAATVAGHAGKVEQLLSAGADPNRVSGGPSEGTPLCAAACWGHTATVVALLAHGADPNLPEDEHSTPLDWAAREMHADVARRLLAAGARPTEAALLVAVERGSLETVRALLDHGADPASADPDGQTALEVARQWAAKDVGSELELEARAISGPDDRVHIHHHPPRVEITINTAAGGKRILVRETSHAEILRLLQQHH